MTTKMKSYDDLRRPVGKRVRRAAQVRRATAEAIAVGRERATAALLTVAKTKAIPEHMPAGLHTVRGLRDRMKEWALNTAARLVAREIERQTFNAAFDRMESSKVGGRKWEVGVWFLVNVMKGNIVM